MRINLSLAGVMVSACICSVAFAQIQDIKIAPPNPEFVKQVAGKRGLAGSVMRTPDGHGLGLAPSPLDLSHLVSRETETRFLRAVTNASYDLRTVGGVTSVKNQGIYGTCWAFASYSSLESCILRSSGTTNDFSENNLADLAGFDLGFDDGGNAVMSTAYLARWAGPVNESDDPYSTNNHANSPSGLLPVKHVQSVEIIGRRRSSTANDELKTAVYNRGAVYVSMSWDSGSYNSTHYSYFMASPLSANHAVAIVGWNDSYSHTNFPSPQPSGDGAFIAKNSWGTSWGESGYFYVSYYDTVFARDSSYLFLNAESTNLYTQVYQHDPLGWVTSLGYSGQTNAWGADIFTITNSGDLGSVGFYATSTNASYQIFVYSGITAGQPRSGALRANQTGSLTNSGYYTIALSSPIALSANEAFSVVVNFTTPNYVYPIAVEYALAGYSSQATASSGQSYISSDGSTWTDATASNSTMSVCIKAFLKPTSYALARPTNLAATEGAYSDRVKLTWSHVPGSSGYSIYRNTTSSTLNASLLGTATTLSYDDTTVLPGTMYYYWVKATGVAGNSDFSAMVSGDAQLSPPSALSASQGTSADNVQLSWNGSSGAAGYIILRSQATESNTASEVARSSLTAYNDSAISAGTLYYYWIKAYTTANTSSYSTGASGYCGFSVPTGVAASDGTYYSCVYVSWNAVNGAVSYQVWRSTTADSASAGKIGETGYNYYIDASATPGITYYYWIQAKKWSITGSFSDYASGWRRSMAAGNNARGDLDGDGIMDFAVYQQATGLWYARLSSQAYATLSYQLGCPGFRSAACDYDGDGHTDPTVYQESTGLWIALLSGSGNTPVYAVLGGTGFMPVQGDFDGDGRADPAVYAEATGTWKVLFSKRNYELVTAVYGGPGYKTVAADYDGDGLVDPAVYYEVPGGNLGQNLGFWYMALSGSGYLSYTKTTTGVGLVPVPADYDGDAKADIATYNSLSGGWSYWSSASNYPLPISFALGGAEYTAIPADYDGDGKADIAVYHEATGQWYFLLSSRSYASAYGELGGPGYEAVGAMR